MPTHTARSAGSQAPQQTPTPALHLVRWTVTSGSNAQSRGAVVISSRDQHWDGSAEGNGPVDALYRAVDRALRDVLVGHPRLIAYDVHAVAEGPDSQGVVTVKLAPPSSAEGRRATGRYTGRATSENIIAASVEAYVDAVNQLLAEEHWADAPAAAGSRRRTGHGTIGVPERAQMDEHEGALDTTDWFNREP